MNDYVGNLSPAELVRRWPHVRLDLIDAECLSKMKTAALDLLNTMCRDAERLNGWLCRINSTWRKGTTGYHPRGEAIDLVFYREHPGDVDVVTQYTFARKYPWGGIGLYPYWNAPGLHVDTRTGYDHICTWWQDKDKKKTYRSFAEYEKVFNVRLV